MSYKGYSARVEYDPRDEIFVGRILGIADAISFHGATVKALTSDFRTAVDHYLADCKATGRDPQKPYSGSLMLRIPPDVHAKIAVQAATHGTSINAWAARVLAEAE
ncbi:type II toxin-antitoxin system HicB family antitoxin [Dokdonella soli]|uniref:Type II toxin-antitoxin system HicB family antitoxin n=2 Tax=Dokdonella soli TaxID=529810 RepID=A0ABN1IGP6_9GAMM